MNSEPFLLFFLGTAVWLLFRISSRLDEQEARWQALLRHLGVDPSKLAEPSDEVKVLASRPGARIEAIKAYRQQTGAGLKEAKAVIDKLIARAGPTG